MIGGNIGAAIHMLKVMNQQGGASQSWESYWVNQTEVLFFGLYSEISGGQMPNKVTGSSDYLTVAGSAGSETYQCPNTAPYIAADTDYIWFKTDETQRTVTTAELIGYDLQRTPVKYEDEAPNEIVAIIILNAAVTGTKRDCLFRDMWLPILWDNDLNGYGHIKDNRIGQQLWTPGLFLDTYPSASAAYSLRKLNSAYEGNCIRVRRSGVSPGEQDIGFVDDFLDMATLAAYVGVNEGYVVKWYDQSGNSRDAYMDNISYQPKIVTSGVIDSFDSIYAIALKVGASQRLAIPKAIYTATDNVSVFIVYGMDTNQTASAILRMIDSSHAFNAAGLHIGHEGRTKKPKIYVYRSGANLTAYSDDAITENTRYVLSAVANRSKLYLDIDGVNKVDAADNDSDFTYTHDLAGIGVNLYNLQGWIAELIIYPSDKATTRLDMAGEIKTYYDS